MKDKPNPVPPFATAPTIDEMQGLIDLLKQSSELTVELERAKTERARIDAELEREKRDHIPPVELMRFLNTLDINCVQIARGIFNDNEVTADVPMTLEAAHLIAN